MSEKYKIDSFQKELDALLKGEYKQDKSESIDGKPLYKEELELVDRILREDFSDESQLREETKRKLIDSINAKEYGMQGHRFRELEEDELTEEELGYASGGHGLREEGACSKCGCKRSRVSIGTAKCPACGHSRDDHM